MPLDKPVPVKDMMGRSLYLKQDPQRIISLVPSLTELLYDLGLDQRVVGITKFCIHPEGWRKEKSIIGGTKTINFEAIHRLDPDLIIANKEENKQEDIEQLSENYPVWVSDISDFDDALHAIEWIGEITRSEKQAQRINFSIHKSWSRIDPFIYEKRTCLYLIWNDPIMIAGKGTYIDDILARINFENLTDKKRYPAISIEEIIALDPEFLFLSSEPFPFKEQHLSYFSKALTKTKVILVNGEMFSWYGSRISLAGDYFSKFLREIDNY